MSSQAMFAGKTIVKKRERVLLHPINTSVRVYYVRHATTDFIRHWK